MNYLVPDPQIILKVTPPRLPRTTQFRERLSFGSVELRDRSILEVNAPSGFGKTTLLGQWRREALNEGNVVAWLTLDENDHATRFAQGIAYAMRLATGRPGFDRISTLSASGDNSTLECLTLWLAEVTILGAKTVLILDEVQSAPVSMLNESLSYLLLNAPSNLYVVLASRRWLALPIPDMVARGLYANVGVEQIRLLPVETSSILNARFGSRISPDDCVRLHEKIAGWPLGLQLAIASIEKKANLGTSIDALASVASNFEQYFLAKFVSDLEASTLVFLEEISILDVFTSDLCRAVTQRSDASDLIESLSETLPVFNGSVESEWMRLHPMALHYFRGRLKDRNPDLTKTLHERAAYWFTERHMIEEAARHQLAAGNDSQAFEMISDHLHGIMTGGHQTQVLEWLARIPAMQIENNPRILLAAGWALAECERHTEVDSLIQKLESHASATESDRFEGMLIRAAAAYFADRPDRAAMILAPWTSPPASTSLQLNAVFANARATILLYEGRPEQARQLIHMSHADWPRSVDAVRCWGEWVTGFSYLWEGQVHLAIEYLEQAMQRSEDALGRRAALSVMFAATLSEALVNAGRVEEAASTLADRLDLIERLSAPQTIAMGYKAAALVALATGQQHRAIDLLNYLYALGEKRRIPRFCISSLAEAIRIHALQGHAETCISTSQRLDAIVSVQLDVEEGMMNSLLNLRVSVAKAYAALAVRDWSAILVNLAPARKIADQLRRGRERIEISLLTAVARHYNAEGDSSPLVEEARGLAEIYGIAGTLFDTNPDLFGWFKGRRPVSLRNDPVIQPISAKHEPKGEKKRPVVRSGGLLTAKEDEILLLLEKNLSNKEIASALGASKDTVKWHIRNLFNKLDAGSRKHAVDRARMLGILTDL